MFNFGKLNRKQKRQFNKEFQKLDTEKKTEVIQGAFIEQVNHTMGKEVAKSIKTGIELEREQIYKKYVTEIDGKKKGSKDWYTAVEKLLSYLRVSHIEAEKRKILREKAEGKGEEKS